MQAPDIRNRITVFAVGLLIILAPVLFLVITISFLIVTEDFALGRLTLFEFLELYLIELVVFAGLAYGLYRLMLTMITQKLPESLDDLERSNVEEAKREEFRDNHE